MQNNEPFEINIRQYASYCILNMKTLTVIFVVISAFCLATSVCRLRRKLKSTDFLCESIESSELKAAKVEIFRFAEQTGDKDYFIRNFMSGLHSGKGVSAINGFKYCNGGENQELINTILPLQINYEDKNFFSFEIGMKVNSKVSLVLSKENVDDYSFLKVDRNFISNFDEYTGSNLLNSAQLAEVNNQIAYAASKRELLQLNSFIDKGTHSGIENLLLIGHLYMNILNHSLELSVYRLFRSLEFNHDVKLDFAGTLSTLISLDKEIDSQINGLLYLHKIYSTEIFIQRNYEQFRYLSMNLSGSVIIPLRMVTGILPNLSFSENQIDVVVARPSIQNSKFSPGFHIRVKSDHKDSNVLKLLKWINCFFFVEKKGNKTRLNLKDISKELDFVLKIDQNTISFTIYFKISKNPKTTKECSMLCEFKADNDNSLKCDYKDSFKSHGLATISKLNFEYQKNSKIEVFEDNIYSSLTTSQADKFS